ncbi:MAG: hypothetical protein D6798_02630 [Deltaproteobacteria bacterium]|nr:MAG: hypothetical protein D6798_02630 [Deltaproteobacteria bacterium]
MSTRFIGSAPRHLLPAAGLIGLCLPLTARAASSGMGSEYLSTGEYAEPNVLFLIDLSPAMDDPCDSASTDPCIDVVTDAIAKITQHYDWARYGVVGTAATVSDDGYTKIAPIGATAAEIDAALASVSTTSVNVRNFAEVLEKLGQNYFPISTSPDDTDDDGDGIVADWTEAPMVYDCQSTHVIVIGRNRPQGDNQVTGTWSPSISPDITCNSAGATSDGSDTLCLYDNVVYKLYSSDLSTTLSGTNNVTVHTVGIDIGSTTVAEALYGNASDVTGGAGVYTVASTADEVLGAILTVMQDIRSGTYSRSTPIVTASGDRLIYSFYELTGDNPLAEGHIRGYEIDNDPLSPTYGEIILDTVSGFGGALWDGGDLLVSRPVPGSEYNPGDMDGVGYRDIYTFLEEAATLSGLATESLIDRRQPMDRQFVTTVGASPVVLDEILDVSAYASTSCTTSSGPFSVYDINEDCSIDSSDLQEMIDFLRGRPDATFRYISQERGYWKLGDAPYGVPAVVEPRLNNAYSMEPSYRKFLNQQQAADYPGMVYMAANDGMLHAFYLDDLPGTAVDEAGEEAWAWMPGYLLYRDKDPAWAGRALDLMVYGRTFLFDGSPVVADVWIDHDGDGQKSCTNIDPGTSTWADCEWHRVIVVQQGKGGPLTMALDITNPLDPQFLWEQLDTVDPTAPGYGVGRPVVAQIRDTEVSTDNRDRYIGIWGSGRAVPYGSSSGTSYFQTAEANLYVWDMAEGPYASVDGWPTAGYSVHGDNGHPEAALMSDGADGDSHYEQAYIGAALAVVDVDSDGDADTVYFPVSTTYISNDGESGSGPDPSPGSSGTTYISDPGSTWMYKACFDPSNPDSLVWSEFFDPVDDGGLTSRPEVFYAATTSFFSDGSLGVYWGTGSPYTRTSSDNGYFFAVRDDNPSSCTSYTTSAVTGGGCGATGVYTLDAGEGLTGEPLVYAGVVYFPTWAPSVDSSGNVDPCTAGTGRIYGLAYDDCAPGIDTNGDGSVDASDSDYVDVGGYVSSLTVTAQGRIAYGVQDASSSSGSADFDFLDPAGNPFLGTAGLAWMEVF